MSDRSGGTSLADLLMAMGVVSVLGAVCLPLIAEAVATARLRHAAGFVATRFRLARASAAAKTTSVAVVFDWTNGRWTFRICEDRNGNVVRRGEIAAGPDVCIEGPHDLAALFPGVQVVADAAIRGPDGEPGSSDAVRFGRSDLASFSPMGTCTAGSLLLRGKSGTPVMVRIAGVTGRARILRYDRAARIWRDG